MQNSLALGDTLVALAMQTCTGCGETKPLDAFLPIESCRASYYGRCRVCRNRRARQRYHSSAAARAAEIARSLRNKRRRAAERRAA